MGYNKRFFYLSLIIILTSINLVSAFDFTVDVDSIPSPKPYVGETVSLGASVTPLVGGGCKLICKWETADFGGEHPINGGQDIPNGTRKDFEYQLIASGLSGNKQFTVDVYCKRSSEGLFCTETEYSKKPSGPFSFPFGFLGDNQCQLKKSNNDPAEDCTKSLSDCPCTSSGTACINSIGSGQWDGRTPDDRQCVTYCGNGIKELNYESCSSCSKDVGKCDLTSCISGSECEGGFCVHEVCLNKPYRDGDNFCDINQGENCKNSNDCACKNDELCSNTGICEKPETSKEEITQAVKSGVQETLEVSKSKQKNITIGAIMLIVLVIILYLIYKFIKGKKAIAKNENKKEEFDKETKIVELERKVKEHKAKIKEIKKGNKK